MYTYILQIPKLFQWLIGVSLFLSIWLAVLLEYVKLDIVDRNKFTILLLPLYLIIAFGCYSVAVIGYRVATFNNCDEAADELKQQIKEARADLSTKGLKFKDS
ncbi:hypothetical protein SNE40_014946 [Patella caerulea]|uniref:Dolichol-phosphate mannosyltransferase subunit 3 n=1 Tax=Patella caerulea TaxID=87958 RepID=A0AAN8PR95_PATCE